MAAKKSSVVAAADNCLSFPKQPANLPVETVTPAVKDVPVDPMAEAYAVAEGLAADAVREWAINASNADDSRNNDMEGVFKALCRGYAAESRRSPADRVDSLSKVLATIERYVTGKAEDDLSDDVLALYTDSLAAGYLYGLAVARAMTTMGAR